MLALTYLNWLCGTYSKIFLVNVNIIYTLSQDFQPLRLDLVHLQGGPYKNKETFKIFSAQILEVYRILLV